MGDEPDEALQRALEENRRRSEAMAESWKTSDLQGVKARAKEKPAGEGGDVQKVD